MSKLNSNPNNLKVGENSVVIGNVSGQVGNNSVVIGATDNKGNIVLNSTMAIGTNAFAGPGSIAIGTNSGAGYEIPIILNQINQLIEHSSDPQLMEKFANFRNILNSQNSLKQNKNILSTLWAAIKVATTLGAAGELTGKITSWIESF